jgi:hypothetical protein
VARRSKAPPPKKVVKYRPYPKYPFPKLRGWRARLSPTRVIEGAAWTRGGSWTNLIYVLFIARAVKKSMKRQPEVLIMDKLKPGQGLSITTAARRGMGKRA